MATATKKTPSKTPSKKAKPATKAKASASKTKAVTKTTKAKVAKAASKVVAKPTAKTTKAKGASKLERGEPERSSPAMAEVDTDVLEFIAAIDDFKRANGRPFPSWSEVLLVVRQLGYKRK